MKKILYITALLLSASISFADQVAFNCSYMQCAAWQSSDAESQISDQTKNQDSTLQSTDLPAYDQQLSGNDTISSQAEKPVLLVSVAPNPKARQTIYENNSNPRQFFIVENLAFIKASGSKKIQHPSLVSALKKALQTKLPAEQFNLITWSSKSKISLAAPEKALTGGYAVTIADFDGLNIESYQVVMDLIDG